MSANIPGQPLIPIIKAHGTNREVGLQIGTACRDLLIKIIEHQKDRVPKGRSYSEQLKLAERYRAPLHAELSWILDEIDGIAEGAGVDARALFAETVEEIWSPSNAAATCERCTDLVAGSPLTKDGLLLIGHNNDLLPELEMCLVGIERAVIGRPQTFTIGPVPFVSVGFNSSGIVLSGNELSANDERIGVSRAHQVFDVLDADNLQEAIRRATRAERASSYNNIILCASGEMVNVEASSQNHELLHLSAAGAFVHTNHYCHPRMLRFERDRAAIHGSCSRFERAAALLAEQEPNSLTIERMQVLLSDHENAPDSLCRHPELYGGEVKTVFWCIFNVTQKSVVFGKGNPCDSFVQSYAFDG